MPCQTRQLHPGSTALALAVLLVLASPPPASAHPMLGDSIQHRVSVSVDPVNIDIQVELTFTDMRSMAERRRMDLDRDWSVSSEEARRFTELVSDRQTGAFGLTIDGRPLRLIPLYDPELDLGGLPQVAPVGHVVRLYYFARTPASLKPGSELVLSDGLWPEAPAILAMTVAGQGGIRMATVTTDPIAPAGKPGSSRLMQAKCAAVPECGVGKAEPAADETPALPVPQPAQISLPTRRTWAGATLCVVLVGFSLKRYLRHRPT